MVHCHPNRIKSIAVPAYATRLCGGWKYSSTHSESRFRRWMATFTPPSVYVRVNSHRALNGRRGGPQTQPWIFGIQKSRLPLLGMEPRRLSCKARKLVTGPIMPSRLHICLHTYIFAHAMQRDMFWYCCVAVSRQYFTVQDRVQSQDSLCGICGEEGENETSISPSLPVSVIPPIFSTQINHRFFEANAGVVFYHSPCHIPCSLCKLAFKFRHTSRR